MMGGILIILICWEPEREKLDVRYLVSAGFVRGHVTLQLCAVAEGVGTQWTAEALLVLLVSVFDVFLQRRQTLVAAVAVRTREQLGEVVWSTGQQVCGRGQRSNDQGWRIDRSMYGGVVVPRSQIKWESHRKKTTIFFSPTVFLYNSFIRI